MKPKLNLIQMGIFALATGLLSGTLSQSASAQIVFSGSDATTTSAANSFRTAIGGVNNGNNPPPQIGGRREVNWDGVALDGTDFGGNTQVIDLNKTVGIPVNRFQARGSLFAEVYAVSGDGFASVNPSIAGQFNAFSPTKTFAMFNDNQIEQSFVFASAPTSAPVQAGTRGFGAIFLDVELANTSSIEYFNGSQSLGKYFVQTGANGSNSFLGVLFDQPIVTSVQLTVGTDTLFNFNGSSFSSGPAENLRSGIDLAAVDDFIYAEPTAVSSVPEPGALAIVGVAGLTLAGWKIRGRKSRK